MRTATISLIKVCLIAVCLITVCLIVVRPAAWGHDAHGRSNAPPEALLLKNPISSSDAAIGNGKRVYGLNCAPCHGEDGKARTSATALSVRPTDLSNYLMDSMQDGEIYWVIAHGIEQNRGTGRAQVPSPDQRLTAPAAAATVVYNMPAFDRLDETQRWETVLYVRELRKRQRAIEVAQLGPYLWDLPPGFPFPNVPAGNPMTREKVELGRYLFYDRDLSSNHTQACASCHQQRLAFTDGRALGSGSTGEIHPRGPMSLVNVAYSPVLTWANPNMRALEAQALVPIFGDDPVELGMMGKEDALLSRLKAQRQYQELFAAAFPAEAAPVTLANLTKALASFERTILSGDSPYDRYRRGDDPGALSDAAKRGEALFFSERTECFHCHGGFNFTGSLDFYGKGFAEIEYHNTGLYNRAGEFSYPEPNLGLFLFTRAPDDVGKFKAPTLRNIAVTAPYMHDGSVKTLKAAIDHYSDGGRTIRSGPNAGVGAENPNRSEFVKPLLLSSREKDDLLAFLNSLTDVGLLTDPRFSNPREAPIGPTVPAVHVILGEVVNVHLEDGAIRLYHFDVPGFLPPMRPPHSMEFLSADKKAVRSLKPGMMITAGVRQRGGDYILDGIRRVY